MIRLLEREFIKNYSFASYIIGNRQKVYAQGWLNDANTDTERNEIKSFINKKFDFTESYLINYSGDFVCNRILHIDINKVDLYLEIFLESFKVLLKDVGIDKVIVVLNSKCDWFSQRNNYKPVREAIMQLREIVGDKHYLGAFEIDITSFNKIINAVFWLGRCNASLPPIHIISEESKTSFMICKHGNLHVETYLDGLDKKLCEASEKLGFSVIQEEVEFLKDE